VLLAVGTLTRPQCVTGIEIFLTLVEETLEIGQCVAERLGQESVIRSGVTGRSKLQTGVGLTISSARK
jgi:hypothetical protein